MIEIAVALIGSGATLAVAWLQNRKTRKAVAPVSNGFAADVRALLNASLEKMERIEGKVDRLDSRLDAHLDDHAHGKVSPIRRRRAS